MAHSYLLSGPKLPEYFEAIETEPYERTWCVEVAARVLHLSPGFMTEVPRKDLASLHCHLLIEPSAWPPVLGAMFLFHPNKRELLTQYDIRSNCREAVETPEFQSGPRFAQTWAYHGAGWHSWSSILQDGLKGTRTRTLANELYLTEDLREAVRSCELDQAIFEENIGSLPFPSKNCVALCRILVDLNSNEFDCSDTSLSDSRVFRIAEPERVVVRAMLTLTERELREPGNVLELGPGEARILQTRAATWPDAETLGRALTSLPLYRELHYSGMDEDEV
jgi:hypothetical protein